MRFAASVAVIHLFSSIAIIPQLCFIVETKSREIVAVEHDRLAKAKRDDSLDPCKIATTIATDRETAQVRTEETGFAVLGKIRLIRTTGKGGKTDFFQRKMKQQAKFLD